MAFIEKAKERMTSRQRVLNTFARCGSDRVPINYGSNPTVEKRLMKYVGLQENDREGLLELLGVDFRAAGVRYTGKELFQKIPGLEVNPIYGFYMRWVENQSGGYWDFCNFPLEDAEPDVIASFPVPDPDDFDYENVEARIKKATEKGKAIYIGGAGDADIINSLGRVMGMENALVNLMTDDEATLAYVDRYHAMQRGILERLLARAAKDIDFIWMGEDLGTQRAPMISLDLYRRVLRPRHQRFVDLGKAYGKPVMVHTCGSSSWAYEDFIQMGVSAVDTLQPEAADMDPRYLVDHFGGRLCFHGCISTAGMLAKGTVEDVRQNVREVLDIMMPNRGYFLAPTHSIQDNTPVENILEMYRAAHTYGVY